MSRLGHFTKITINRQFIDPIIYHDRRVHLSKLSEMLQLTDNNIRKIIDNHNTSQKNKAITDWFIFLVGEKTDTPHESKQNNYIYKNRCIKP